MKAKISNEAQKDKASSQAQNVWYRRHLPVSRLGKGRRYRSGHALRVSSAAAGRWWNGHGPPPVLGHRRLVILDLSPQDTSHWAYIHDLIKDQLEKKRDNRKVLWTLLVFQIWYAKYKADF